MLVAFARIKNKQGILSLIASKAMNRKSSRQRYYSLATDEAAAETSSKENETNREDHVEIAAETEEEGEEGEEESQNFVYSNQAKSSELDEQSK